MLICVSNWVGSSKSWDLRSVVRVSDPKGEDQGPLGPLDPNLGWTKMLPVPRLSQIPSILWEPQSGRSWLWNMLEFPNMWYRPYHRLTSPTYLPFLFSHSCSFLYLINPRGPLSYSDLFETDMSSPWGQSLVNISRLSHASLSTLLNESYSRWYHGSELWTLRLFLNLSQPQSSYFFMWNFIPWCPAPQPAPLHTFSACQNNDRY